jgi:hypothetical protein
MIYPLMQTPLRSGFSPEIEGLVGCTLEMKPLGHIQIWEH